MKNKNEIQERIESLQFNELIEELASLSEKIGRNDNDLQQQMFYREIVKMIKEEISIKR